jgi:hypothetical protein
MDSRLSPMSEPQKLVLRDIDNRDEEMAPYEFIGEVETICGYIDGPVRKDSRDVTGLDQALEAIRRGELGIANDHLNKRFGIYLREATPEDSREIEFEDD